MNDLLESITKLVSKNKPNRVDSLSGLIRKCKDSEDISILSGWANSSQTRQQLNEMVEIWKSSSISSVELAGMIMGANHAYHSAKKEEQVELVWTGPSTPMMSTRRTEQALLEVINSAQNSLFLISFVAYEVASITAALNEAVARGVEVSILMEPAESHGGQIKDDCFSAMKYAVPNATLYVWSHSSKEEMGGGYRIVHAKCSVADSKLAFITSANLTGAALDRNMELGVLISGSSTPKKLYNHINSLVATKAIIPFCGL